AGAVAAAAARSGGSVNVIPAGERWADGSLRPSLEDWLGAGAVLSRLPGSRSPQADAAVRLFERFRDTLPGTPRQCAPGRELEERGQLDDIALAVELDASTCAPRFDGAAFVAGETPQGPPCRHAFENTRVHAHGQGGCRNHGGRRAHRLADLHEQSLPDIFNGDRARDLRRLVLSTGDDYCRAIAKRCPLKNMSIGPGDDFSAALRYLAIEPTTACDLRCLVCPVRDFSGDVTWRD